MSSGLAPMQDNLAMNSVTEPFVHSFMPAAGVSDSAADLGLTWRNSFAALGKSFFTPLAPQSLPDPYWVGKSQLVAHLLELNPGLFDTDELLQALSGNRLIRGSFPLASVYSGHQFGVWAGQLGDGRALLLGETQAGLELQLKGAGRTPYSRMGDGRAVLRSSIREFLCSEAMHGLGIATTRALCVTGSDATVLREERETAAVVTRVAPSFIRFGHFEHFSNLGDHAALKTLADYVIQRFYPQCLASIRYPGNPYAALLEAVSERTAELLARWQAVGFCHGVMNTDNMSVLGLTIDYGPFQFLDVFDPGHICNHSDSQGRYAFNKQPNIAYWNLFCLGQALLPLIEDQDLALAALESYKQVFPASLEARMRAKLGLSDVRPEDRDLIDSVLKLLAQNRVDYSIFWRRLSHYQRDGNPTPVRDLFLEPFGLGAWLLQYNERTIHIDKGVCADLMLKSNPKYVLRNHLGEQAIRLAKARDYSGVSNLLKVLENPFDEHPGFEAYADFPPDWASSIEISCSS